MNGSGLRGRGAREEGAIALIVAVLFGTFVLIGCAALTIDVGNINLDRRQLQNGADAVAFAVAKDCVKNGTCAPTDPSLQALANGNAADGATEIRRVDGLAPAICGKAPGLVACPVAANSGNLQECPTSSLPSSVNYVRVYAETKNAGGTHLLPYSFGAAITGAGSGANQQACASVSWGPAGGGRVAFPVTFSYCDWLAKTGANPSATPPVPGNYLPPPAAGLNPGYGAVAPNTPWPPAASEVTLYTQAHGATSCTTWNGHVAPGNFSTLDNIGCNAVADDLGWIQGDTGGSIPCDKNTLDGLIGQIIYIPIFDCDSPTYNNTVDCSAAHGSHDWYHISGYAAFYVTGFYFASSGNQGRSIFPPDNNAKPCNGGDRCVSGWFTTGTLQTTIDTSGAPGFGSTVVQVTG